MSVHDILERGYFPWEVPPSFSTVQLANHVLNAGHQALLAAHAPGWTRPARHNLARPAGLRRALSVPNPLNFIAVAAAVDDAWTPTIAPLLATAQLAVKRPHLSLGPRAFAPQPAVSDAEARAASRASARILLKADIQNFYPSIYTHSIPWALHTKAVAKANINNPALIGNVIDKAVQRGQEGQTMGLPIGCDTSWVLAECVLARIEEGLRARLPQLRGFRYTDDFELTFASARDAEAALGALQEVLADYELSVNPRKTSISPLPDLVESSGVDELRRWTFRTNAAAQKTDIVGFFDLLSEHVRHQHGSTISSYAIARLRTQAFLPSSWALVEGFLLQLLVAEPFCAKQVAMTLSMLATAGHAVAQARLSEAVERMIVYHAPLGHGSEVAWALWLSLAHQAPVTQAAADALAPMNDCFVALLALHAKAQALIAGQLNTGAWEQAMVTDELKGSMWLLSYEARLKGWLQSLNGQNHVLANPFFAQLFVAGVSFYDTSALSLTFQPNQFFATAGGAGGGYGAQ